MEAKKYSPAIEESTITERIARIVSSVRTTKPDYAQLAAELEQAIPFEVFGVVLLRYDQQAVRVIVCQQQVGKWEAVHHQHPYDGSMLQQIAQTEQPGLVVATYPDGLDGLPATHGDALSGYHQLRSTLIAPLMIENRVLGTLELGSTAVGTYKDQNLQRLVRAVVHVLATAIAGAQSVGSAEIQDKQRKALQVVSSSLTSKIDLPTILTQIVAGIAQSLNVASAIFMYDRQRQELTLEAQAGLDEAILKKVLNGNLPLLDTCIISRAVKLSQPQVTQDIIIDEQFHASRDLFSALGMRSIFSHPLFADTTVYGALLLCSSEPGGFTPLKIDILSLFASQATIAIRNGMLLESVHQRSYFRQTIDQLELIREQGEATIADAEELSEEEKKAILEQQLQAEFALFKQAKQATRETFGVDFFTILHFISDYLPSQSELNLLSKLHSSQEEQAFPVTNTSRIVDSAGLPASTNVVREQIVPFADTMTALIRTAEAALENAARLGELGRLSAQLQQSANCVTDAWFMIDLHEHCTYMNPAAEAFCNMHLDVMETAYTIRSLPLMQQRRESLPMEQALEKVWPRLRNAQEVRAYLKDFERDCKYRPELRCILVTELIIHQRHIAVTDSLPSDRHYHLTRYPLYNQQGQLEGNALQIRDVTQKVRDENNMSMLLSSVSHDLRTPLTTIKAAASGLLQTNVAWSEEDRQEMLEDIDRETDHLTVLINALVELSRIKMGALILEKEWCDLVEILNGALAKIARLTLGHRIEVHVEDKLPLLYVDHVQIERVFYNLLENAIRRSPEQAAVHVFIKSIDEPTGMLEIVVIDQGQPVLERESEDIFESYVGLRTHGNGLGLSICKGIVEAHQGTIFIETAAKVGSTVVSNGVGFVFTLPVLSRPSVHDGEQTALAVNEMEEAERPLLSGVVREVLK